MSKQTSGVLISSTCVKKFRLAEDKALLTSVISLYCHLFSSNDFSSDDAGVYNPAKYHINKYNRIEISPLYEVFF